MSDTALLSIEHLKKAYGDNVVLEDISLSVKRGEVIVVIRPLGMRQVNLPALHQCP